MFRAYAIAPSMVVSGFLLTDNRSDGCYVESVNLMRTDLPGTILPLSE
jgi:hypothetical protein